MQATGQIRGIWVQLGRKLVPPGQLAVSSPQILHIYSAVS